MLTSSDFSTPAKRLHLRGPRHPFVRPRTDETELTHLMIGEIDRNYAASDVYGPLSRQRNLRHLCLAQTHVRRGLLDVTAGLLAEGRLASLTVRSRMTPARLGVLAKAIARRRRPMALELRDVESVDGALYIMAGALHTLRLRNVPTPTGLGDFVRASCGALWHLDLRNMILNSAQLRDLCAALNESPPLHSVRLPMLGVSDPDKYGRLLVSLRRAHQVVLDDCRVCSRAMAADLHALAENTNLRLYNTKDPFSFL